MPCGSPTSGSRPRVKRSSRPGPCWCRSPRRWASAARLTNEIIKGVILPQFVILPLAVLLVWLALARGIAPLNELQRRIRSRESSDLSPIDEQRVPDEVAPLVQAINDLLACGWIQSMSRQKHFLADAAHQLKTPLAGLRTQAELDPARDRRRAVRLARGVEALARPYRARPASGRPTWSTSCSSMARAEDAEQAHAPRAGQPGRDRRRHGARFRSARAGASHRPGL